MTDIVTIYAIFGSTEEAQAIGEAMIAEKRAACVNILAPCRSLFRWDGDVQAEEEIPALFKTTRAGADALMNAIIERHSYDTPALCVWPIDRAAPGYAEWVGEEVDEA